MKKLTYILAIATSLTSQLPAQVYQNGSPERRNSLCPITNERFDYEITSNTIIYPIGLQTNEVSTNNSPSENVQLRVITGDGGVSESTITGILCTYGMDGRPEKLMGQYKANFIAEGYSTIDVQLFHSDEGLIALGSLSITNNTNIFLPFEVPVEYFVPSINADSFSISLRSSEVTRVPGIDVVMNDLAFEETAVIDPTFSRPSATILRPNPATDELSVEVPENTGRVNFSIYDMNGTQIENEYFFDKIRIDVSGLNPGTYFYKIRLSNNQILDNGILTILEPND